MTNQPEEHRDLRRSELNEADWVEILLSGPEGRLRLGVEADHYTPVELAATPQRGAPRRRSHPFFFGAPSGSLRRRPGAAVDHNDPDRVLIGWGTKVKVRGMQQADRREGRRERLELFRLGSYHGPPALLIVRPARLAVEPAAGWVAMASPRVATPQAEPILHQAVD